MGTSAVLGQSLGVAAAPGDGDMQPVGGRKQRPDPAAEHPVRGIGHDVQRKGGIGQR